MKSEEAGKGQRILSRLLAKELSPEELQFVRGTQADNQEAPAEGGDGGMTTLVSTTPPGCEDS